MLYLLRHGSAERGDGDDAARRLTEEGERQSRAAGRAMAALGLDLDACLTSPKVRALDTARLACEQLGIEPEVQPELAGSGYDATALATGLGDVALVGHNPDFTTELQRITGANVKLRKGGLAIIDGSLLISLLRPEELEAIAEGAEK
jgi:phosphohistidine phosphatase